MKYHISRNGEPGRCKAESGNCPLSKDEDTPSPHFDNFAEAKAYAEQKAYRDVRRQTSLNDRAKAEEVLLKRVLKTGKISQLELAAHKDYAHDVVNTLVEHGYETINTYAETINGMLVFNEERAKQHQEIIDSELKKYENVPNDGEVVISGGLGGAGKTTVLTKFAGIDTENYATVNPDDLKEVMAEKGMIPKVKGLTPMDANPLVHEEAPYLSKVILRRLQGQKKNVILDVTMSSLPSVEKKVNDFRSSGYEKVEAIFVDITPETSLQRSENRYALGFNDYVKGEGNGGRLLPEHVVGNQRSDDENFLSKNSKTLVEAHKKGLFTSVPRVFNNNVNGRSPMEKDYAEFSGDYSEMFV